MQVLGPSQHDSLNPYDDTSERYQESSQSWIIHAQSLRLLMQACHRPYVQLLLWQSASGILHWLSLHCAAQQQVLQRLQVSHSSDIQQPLLMHPRQMPIMPAVPWMQCTQAPQAGGVVGSYKQCQVGMKLRGRGRAYSLKGCMSPPRLPWLCLGPADQPCSCPGQLDRLCALFIANVALACS